MLNHLVIRADPDHYQVEVPIRTSQLSKVISVLKDLGFPPVPRGGGPGWILDEGCICLAGSQAGVEKAMQAIDHNLNPPRWETGLEVAQRHKKGALP